MFPRIVFVFFFHRKQFKESQGLIFFKLWKDFLNVKILEPSFTFNDAMKFKSVISTVSNIYTRDRMGGPTKGGWGDQKSHSGPFTTAKAPKISLSGPFLGPKMDIFDILRRRIIRKKIFEFKRP